MRRIYAFITLYNPDLSVSYKVGRISNQVDKVYLCDNSSSDNSYFFKSYENIEYIAFKKNLGIAGAFNNAINHCCRKMNPKDFLIFFDQDSEIEAGYISALLDEYEEIEKTYDNLGCLGPVFYNTSNHLLEVPKIKTALTTYSYKVNNIITSSLVTRYKNLVTINFWNENLFLDLVDWDLCWRMKKEGFICAITDKVTLRHSVGSGEKKIGIIRLRVGQPFREYYQIRDSLYLLQQDYVPVKMRFRLIANVTIRPIVHYLFLDHRHERIAYIRQGRRDFRKGLHGEYTKES